GRHHADARAGRQQLLELGRGDTAAPDEQHGSPGEIEKQWQEIRHIARLKPSRSQTKKAREAGKPPGPWVVVVCWTRSRCDRRLASSWTIGAGAHREPATTTAATHAGRLTNHDGLFYSLREAESSFSVNWNDAIPLRHDPGRCPVHSLTRFGPTTSDHCDTGPLRPGVRGRSRARAVRRDRNDTRPGRRADAPGRGPRPGHSVPAGDHRRRRVVAD